MILYVFSEKESLTKNYVILSMIFILYVVTTELPFSASSYEGKPRAV